MPRFAANLSLMFNELPFLERFEAAAAAGFSAVEFLFPYAWAAEEIRSRLLQNGLTLVLFNIAPGDWDQGERGLAALPGRESDFTRNAGQALKYAEALDCPRLHAMAGHDGDHATYIRNLRRVARMAAISGVELLIEPINTRDMPRYFLNFTRQASDVIAEVAEPNLGLQLDLYHRHVMEGGVSGAIQQYAGEVRHYQIASPPDRGEPDRGELDFAELFGKIDRTGYGGWIGCEYRPRGETKAGLDWMQSLGVRPH